jgi:hypothetical protein
MTGQLHDTLPATGTPRRADYGAVRLGQRDIDGLLLPPPPPVRRRGVRGHRTIRPRHVQRPETGKRTRPAGNPAIRHLLASQLPTTDAQATADRAAQLTALRARHARIEATKDSKIIELEELPADPDDPATQAYRARIRARFAELHNEREQLETQLKTLAKTTPAAADTTLLDQLPLAGDILPGLPPSSKPAYSPPSTSPSCGTNPASKPPSAPRSPKPPCKPSTASSTPPQDGYHDTATDEPTPMGDLNNTHRACTLPQPVVLFRYVS